MNFITSNAPPMISANIAARISRRERSGDAGVVTGVVAVMWNHSVRSDVFPLRCLTIYPMQGKDSSESKRLMPLERHVGRHSPATLREQAAATYARRHLKSLDHELRVLVIATKLFDLTDALHDLRPRDRRTLRLAALTHDVGRRFGERNHPADGARMIAEDESLPISTRQRRAISYLTRYHRGAVPRIGYDEILRRGDGRKALLKILALLRAADALDNRQLHPPTIAIALKGRKLSIICFVESDLNKARKAFRRRKKFRLLEELLELKVDVDVQRAHTVQHA
jgi:hypothetical protein